MYRNMMNDPNWYAETFNVLDVNPNSNGKLSPDAVVEQEEFINSINVAKPTVRGNSGSSNVHSRNIKRYNNCVNSCCTKEQEELLANGLNKLHLDIMELGTGKGNGKTNDGSIASLAAVETAASYARKKPMTSPSRYK